MWRGRRTKTRGCYSCELLATSFLGLGNSNNSYWLWSVIIILPWRRRTYTHSRTTQIKSNCFLLYFMIHWRYTKVTSHGELTFSVGMTLSSDAIEFGRRWIYEELWRTLRPDHTKPYKQICWFYLVYLLINNDGTQRFNEATRLIILNRRKQTANGSFIWF